MLLDERQSAIEDLRRVVVKGGDVVAVVQWPHLRPGQRRPAAGNSGGADSSATSLSHSEQPANPARKTTGCHDCLLCQLHQNLNTTLITYRLVDPPQQLQLRVSLTTVRDVFSQSASATSGRAPPFIS